MAGDPKRARQATEAQRLREINEFCHPLAATLTVAKATASRLGLVQTCKAIDEATNSLGWEVAEALRDAGHGMGH